MTTLHELIRVHADDVSAATRPLLLSPGRPPLRYADFEEQRSQVARCLSACGVTRGDRVAIVAANGPEMASSFLAVASVATVAPLNPTSRDSELELYFDDLRPKALIVDPALPSPAGAIARERGIAVLELRTQPAWPAGRFELSCGACSGRGLPPARPDDIGLVLHTSGTTSRPKMVPLSQTNLSSSAHHIARTLRLAAGDRCLNIMPLFHIHGLVGVLLSSVHAGASVVCTTGFDAARFFGWLEEERPTWISAVPTMYQAIVGGAPAHRREIHAAPLRLLRSSSAPLPPSLMATLEQTFGVPVIEAYGMTEAAHQMASNPLPPRERRPGSVGLAAGPAIAIMHAERFELLNAGEVGEIVVRGPNVTSGYLPTIHSNDGAFCEGWFRTGDQGYFDADGYLFINGRLKEQINRGGEKISPREVDEAILALPEVRQAVAFAVPHETLGEDIAAAVVLRDGATLTEEAVRAHVGRHLAAFKVPSRVLFVPAIPTGPTGKLQRIGLAGRLSLLPDAYVAPTNGVQARLAEVWAQVLRVDRVGIRSNFFALGGDSLRALQLASLASGRGMVVPVDILFREPTIERLAPHVEEAQDFSGARDGEPGAVGLHGVQSVVLLGGRRQPMTFTSPSEVVFELEGPVHRGALVRAVQALSLHHDALRLCFSLSGRAWKQALLASDALARDAPGAIDAAILECAPQALVSVIARLHHQFDLAKPPLFRFAFTSGAPGKVAIIAHHLVADAISMRILAEDFAAAYACALSDRAIALAPVPTPASAFMRRYERAIRAGRFAPDQEAWLHMVDDDGLPPNQPRWATVASMRHVPLDLGRTGARLLAYAQRQNAAPRDVLLAASVDAAAAALALDVVRVLITSSGRERSLFGDLSRTVGCLTNVMPLQLRPPRSAAFEDALRATTEALNRVPSGGFSIAAVYQSEPSDVWRRITMQLVTAHMLFNYKGVLGPRSPLGPSGPGMRALPSTYDMPRMMAQVHPADGVVSRAFALQLHFEQVGDLLLGDLYYAADLHDDRTARELAERLRARLEGVGAPAEQPSDGRRSSPNPGA